MDLIANQTEVGKEAGVLYLNTYVDHNDVRWFQILSEMKMIFPDYDRGYRGWWATQQECDGAGWGGFVRDQMENNRANVVELEMPF